MALELVTVSVDPENRDKINSQLTALMGNDFKIISYSCQEYAHLAEHPEKVVLLSAPVVRDLIIDHVPETCTVFIAKRVINPKALRRIFSIPPGSEVLVVNNLYKNAIEVVDELNALGFRHLHFTAHMPGTVPDKQYEYAVTPNEEALVPQGIPQIINLGTRLVSLMSIAQVIFHMTGGRMGESMIYERYVKYLVTLSSNLSIKFKKRMLMQRQMNMVLSAFEDGAIIASKSGRITFSNSAARLILHEAQLDAKNVCDLGLSADILEPGSSFIVRGNTTIYFEVKKLPLSEDEYIFLITLKDVNRVASIDKEYKKFKKVQDNAAKFRFKNILYKSSAMARTIALAQRVSQRDATILITGESGTGKELLAQSIHNASLRKAYPFVAINCAALSVTLLESELFGYEDGAFTGARKGGKKGLFEAADGGTLFLDELGDAPLSTQIKLLRVLQEREVMRIAGNTIIPVNVRVIAATNKDLHKEMTLGNFREDLYYRLNVINIRVPPLRHRTGDVDLLLRTFLERKSVPSDVITPEMLSLLEGYDWPGNIRELKNIAEYISVMYDSTPVLADELAQMFSRPGRAARREELPASVAASEAGGTATQYFRSSAMGGDILHILEVLRKAREAGLLMGRSSIQKRLRDLGLELSAQQIKTRLDRLRERGFTISSNGRGTVLTDKGLDFLRQGAE